MAIGSVLGMSRGGLWGGLVGAALGHWLEEQIRGAKPPPRGRPHAAPPPPPPPADDPYVILGARREMSGDALRACYRDRVKHLHPDVLRAQGATDERLARANDEMARLNAAWDEIKRERGL